MRQGKGTGRGKMSQIREEKKRIQVQENL